jgi:hypothetical protein
MEYSDGILMLNPIEPKRLTTSWELKFTPAFSSVVRAIPLFRYIHDRANDFSNFPRFIRHGMRNTMKVAVRARCFHDIHSISGLPHPATPKKKEPTIEEKRERGLYGLYNRLVGQAIAHRWIVLLTSLVFLVIGGLFASRLKQQFFPKTSDTGSISTSGGRAMCR